MPKKSGRGPKKNRRGGSGGSPGPGGAGGVAGGTRGRPGRGGGKRGHGGAGAGGKRPTRPAQKSDYFLQPGRRGMVSVLRRPIGNRADAKICGEMPSHVHAKLLVQQLERAESVVKDLFMEATDDGIEALEAVLAACREEVMKRGPHVQPPTDSEKMELPEIQPAEYAPEDEPGGEG
jgi:hypothetical protein